MLALILAFSLFGIQPAEQLADIQVHGNTLTPDARIIEIAGVQIGSPVAPTLTDDVERRLRNAHLFEKVEVLKRFASIADPSQISLVIVVDEGRVEVFDNVGPIPAGVRKRGGPNLMAIPLLNGEDGYGLTYGAQLAVPEPFGPDSRLSFPLTWGGDKRAAIEAELPFTNFPITRMKAGAAIQRRENPRYDEPDDRRTVWWRAERDVSHTLRLGGSAALQRVSFLGDQDRHSEFGVDAVFDTRVDPFLPGNAFYGRAAWSHLQFDHSPDANRSELDARGYIRAPRASVIMLRAQRQSSTEPLPLAMKPLLGGTANLRGFPAGTAVGDTLVSATAEWRIPLNSPLKVAKVGVSAFIDAGTVYDVGSRFRDQELSRGAGAGVWLAAAIVRVNLQVAHGIGGSTRVHFTLATTF